MSALAVPNLVEERRKHSQHRYIERLHRHEGDLQGGRKCGPLAGRISASKRSFPGEKAHRRSRQNSRSNAKGCPFSELGGRL